MTDTSKIEDSVLAGLTDEERAAIAGSEDDATDDGEQSAAPSSIAEELRNDPAPILPTSGPMDAEQRMAAIRSAREDVVRRFEDGDITAREYANGLEVLNERRNEIERERLKADIGREAHENAIKNQWETEVTKFMGSTGRHLVERGERALMAFDEYVKSVTADPANARLSDRAQLDKAYRLFQQDFGSAGGKGQPSRAAQDDHLASLRARNDEHARDAADFAYLDRLADADPMAYEAALARMSRDEQEAYGQH